MKKFKVNNIENGIYWGKTKITKRNIKEFWHLVDVHVYEEKKNPDSKRQVKAYVFGWDIAEDLDNYQFFVPANLKNPDGENYG